MRAAVVALVSLLTLAPELPAQRGAGVITTIAGTTPVGGSPQRGYSGDGGPATSALLSLANVQNEVAECDPNRAQYEQTSRIDAVEVALLKARRSGHDTHGAVLASDGFFPFGDWVEPARAAGITAAIQPGGSMRDAESVAACDQAGIALVLTGRRLFKH